MPIRKADTHLSSPFVKKQKVKHTMSVTEIQLSVPKYTVERYTFSPILSKQNLYVIIMDINTMFRVIFAKDVVDYSKVYTLTNYSLLHSIYDTSDLLILIAGDTKNVAIIDNKQSIIELDRNYVLIPTEYRYNITQENVKLSRSYAFSLPKRNNIGSYAPRLLPRTPPSSPIPDCNL